MNDDGAVPQTRTHPPPPRRRRRTKNKHSVFLGRSTSLGRTTAFEVSVLVGFLLLLLLGMMVVWRQGSHPWDTGAPAAAAATDPPPLARGSPMEHAVVQPGISTAEKTFRRPVATHMIQWTSHGRWVPPLHPKRKETFRHWTERLVDNAGAERSPFPGVAFVGLVRISKTATSSLLDFLHRRLPTYLRSLDYPSFLEHVLEGQVDSGRALFTACLFGLAPEEKGALSESIDPPHPQRNLESSVSCPHFSYDRILSQWARSLPNLVALSNWTVPNNRKTRRRQEQPRPDTAVPVKLNVITLLREPMDRYESYFHYWRNTYPDWKIETDPLLLETLEQGRFADFLELVPQSRRNVWAEQAKRPHVASGSQPPRWMTALTGAFQFEYFDRTNVTEAMTVIDRPFARVLPLLTACFDASLHLLADLFPQHLDASAVESFLQSGKDRVHVRARAARRIDLPEIIGLAPVVPYDATTLRRRAREGWLVDEYRFYQAAVQQFRRILEASNVGRAIVHECTHRLDQEEAQ